MRDSLIEGETHSKPKNKWLINAFWLILGAGIATGIILGVKSKSSDDNTCPSGPSLPAYNPDEYDRLDAFYNKTEAHSFTQADNVRTDRVGAAVPNPAYPRLIAYTRTQYYLPDANASTTTLWITILSDDLHRSNLTSHPFQLTQPRWGVNDNSPAWSKDGKHLLFLSNRDNNGTQLYQLTIPSSLYNDYTPLNDVITSTRAITNFPISIDNFLWSATNDVAAISVQVYPKMNMFETVAYQQNITESHVEGQLYDKLYVRHWDEWFQCRPSVGCLRNHPHLLSLTLDNGEYKVHDVRDILAGIDSDSPTRPFGGVEQWSFNSRGLIFAFTRQQGKVTSEGEDTSVAWNTDLNIHTIQFDLINNTFTPYPIHCHTCDNIAEDTNPSFAPGWDQPNTLAYLAMTRPQYESDRLRVRLFSDITNLTSPFQELTANWDLSVSSLVWSAPINGTSTLMYLGVEEAASDVLYVLDLISRLPPTKFPATQRGAVSAHVVSADGSYLVHTWSSMQSPAHLRYISLQLYLPITITQHNKQWLQKVQLTSKDLTETFTFNCSNGDPCSGWIMPPVDFDASKSYPMAFLIHGGPQGAWTDSWSYRWNPQAYTGAGFVAVMINPHGSTGYGQNFTDAIIGRYGSWPFADLTQYGLPYVLKTYPFINASRVVALGASYGGYMINWIAGQPEAKNFTALVTHDGMFDIRAFYYQTEEVYFPEHDNGGVTPYQNATAYEEWSPINHVDKWKQPMFVIHGGHDYRIPEAQGISVFTATQRLGIKGCKFLYFPKENHWVLKPANSIFWHNEVLDFIKTHTKL